MLWRKIKLSRRIGIAKEGTPLHKGSPHCQLSGWKTHLLIRGWWHGWSREVFDGQQSAWCIPGTAKSGRTDQAKESDRWGLSEVERDHARTCGIQIAFIYNYLGYSQSKVAQIVKNLPRMQETQVHFLGLKDPLQRGMATHSSILAWRIPWTKEPGGLQSTGSQRVGHDWVANTFLEWDGQSWEGLEQISDLYYSKHEKEMFNVTTSCGEFSVFHVIIFNASLKKNLSKCTPKTHTYSFTTTSSSHSISFQVEYIYSKITWWHQNNLLN